MRRSMRRQDISKVSVDRWFCCGFEDSVVQVQLHVFCDTSEAAYGSTAYFRFSFKSGGHACRFALAKSKLSPIKAVTLARLEFTAALTGVRMYKMLIHETDLPVEKVYFWTDSTLTLQYIRNTTQRLKAYVANRKTEINEATDPDDWRHIPGELNPADLLTRGVTNPAQLMECNTHGTSGSSLWGSSPSE